MESLIWIVLILGVCALAGLGFLFARQNAYIKAQDKRIQQALTLLEQQAGSEKWSKSLKTDAIAKTSPEITVSQPLRFTGPDKAGISVSSLAGVKTNGEIEITPEIKRALDLFESDSPCIFITGKAGTGKSTLLTYFVDHTQKAVVLLAPTGMAALRISGQTLHSFFGFPPRMLTDEDIKPSFKAPLFQALDTIIIDEISMIRADLLDRVDEFLRLNGRDPHKPFGGIQMIFFGDPYQLAPIVKTPEENMYMAENYRSPFFFDARIIQQLGMKTLELTKIYRQNEVEFIEALNAIRTNCPSETTFRTINHGHLLANPGQRSNFITLTSTNQVAREINTVELRKIDSPIFSYQATFEGKFNYKKESELPVEPVVNLKVGAQVIFVQNDLSKRWLNGEMGLVTELSADWIRVELKRGGQGFNYQVSQASWDMIEYTFDFGTRKIKPEVVGRFIQVPLKLGWAITIHKSQGSTMERTHVDFGKGAFAQGQAYVALSRCRSLQGLTLERPLASSDIKSVVEINRFMALAVDQTDQANHYEKRLASESAAGHPKNTSVNSILLKVDEDQKYGKSEPYERSWYAPKDTKMVLPLRNDRARGIDLKSFPGYCKIFMGDKFAWNANISGILAAQSLWKAVEGYDNVSIEPDCECPTVPLADRKIV